MSDRRSEPQGRRASSAAVLGSGTRSRRERRNGVSGRSNAQPAVLQRPTVGTAVVPPPALSEALRTRPGRGFRTRQKVPAGGQDARALTSTRSGVRRGPSCGSRRRAERLARDVTMPAERCPAAGGVIPSTSTSDGAMTDLVERDSELAAIATFVRRGGVMLIEAGAGVGKTSLLEAT